ncbi:T-cell surface glycoprotein CD5-like isoform X1 [Salvelinus fontinalis]|uniref:T-cell surface glycoprotein CD5-like isoform X1 n=1 Tax=Salvelinus fontinalis TaxID=8038 RepID=UPI002486AA8D|nr:T-cell surface glycoprotein CD5-like isoform X1 [Salvelinus fontinalis]
MRCVSSLLLSPVFLNLFISRMDGRLVLIILAMCVMNVVTIENKTSTSQPLTPSNSTPTTSGPPATPTTSCVCNISTSCSSPTKPESPPPALGVVKVNWEINSCKGDIHLSLLLSHSFPLCFNSRANLSFELAELCERNGCKGSAKWTDTPASSEGYQIDRDGRVTNNSCTTLGIQCEVVPDQLVGYKVVTGLLCVLVLVVLMVRFGQPSFKALRKRLSDKRQSRWIGPTQSQSVSYHRGKAGLQLNDNTDKRHSYPGLERLTVNTSREPSSNRNSDYDSYNL